MFIGNMIDNSWIMIFNNRMTELDVLPYLYTVDFNVERINCVKLMKYSYANVQKNNTNIKTRPILACAR